MVPLAKRAAQREAGDSVLALYLAKPPSVAFKSFGSLTSFCVEADMVGRKILQRRGKKGLLHSTSFLEFRLSCLRAMVFTASRTRTPCPSQGGHLQARARRSQVGVRAS